MAADQDTKEKGAASVVHALLSFLPVEIREMVGVFTGFVLVFAIPAAIILGLMILYHTMQKSKNTEIPCWQIQVVENRLFKLNACTGELTEVKDLPPPTASAPKK